VRKTPPTLGTKAGFPNFIEPALATMIEKAAERRALGSRDQVRWLPRAGSHYQHRRESVHAARSRSSVRK
jgi:hypothetical protein